MGKYSKISGNTFYRNFPTRPTYGVPTYGGITVFNIILTDTKTFKFIFSHHHHHRILKEFFPSLIHLCYHFCVRIFAIYSVF